MDIDLPLDDGSGRSLCLHAYTGGRPFDAALPVVVFLHGALNDHSVWTLAARWCAHHGHAALALDLPGHGRSSGPVLPDVERLGAAVHALLRRLGVRRAALVGHSMGSLIALEAAATPVAPDDAAAPCIDRLVMVGTAFPMRVSPALLDGAIRQPLAAIDQVVSFSHAGLAAQPSYPGPGSWLPGGSRALMRQVLARSHGVEGCEHNLFHHDFAACDRYTGAIEAARRLRAAGTCRSHLILAGRDRMTAPKQAATLASELGAEVHTLARAGHFLMQDDPEGFLAALRLALR